MQLRNLRALITGGGRGIGAATAQAFEAAGAQVLTADIDSTANPSLVVDVTDGDAVSRAVAEAVQRLGGLDLLVCSAGRLYAESSLTALEDTWNECLNVNLKSVWLCARAAAPALRQSNAGSIVTVGSAQAFRTAGKAFPYGAAKGGLLSLTRSLAVELAPQVRVNSVIPGQIESVRTAAYFESFSDRDEAYRRTVRSFPMGRLGQPTDVANAIVFLSSPNASWITGTFLTVDGGRDAAALDLSDLRNDA